jgi:topoisomerase-4 subunit A
MRLRSLRKLEEMEIRKEHDALTAEKGTLTALLASEELQTEALTEEIKDIKKQFGDKRRTEITGAPSAVVIPLEAQVEREPVTVLLSKQGWLKTIKGHNDEDVKYKEGDGELYRVHSQTTNHICALGRSGRVFSLPVAKMPSGRGFGEPIKLMVDIAPDDEIVAVVDSQHKRFMLATEQGYGFVTQADSLISQMRTGKQVLNVGKGDKAKFCIPAEGNMVATYGSNRKLLVYPLEEVSELQRGKGVRLMTLKKATLEDLCVFNVAAGLGIRQGKDGDREKVFTDVSDWFGKRAQAGKLPPHGYQKQLALFAPSLPNDEEALKNLPSIADLVEAATSKKEAKEKEEKGPGLFDLDS